MKRKFGASGLMFALVGGLTASCATSAMADGLPSFVKDLSYEDQNKIYENLTSNSFGFFGKNLGSTSKEGIVEQLNDLRNKNKNRFDQYVKENYAANSLVSSWEKIPSANEGGITPLNELLNKLNSKKENGEGSSLYSKEYLVRNPYFAIDAAYNTNSSLVSGVDKSAVIKKVKDNAKYLGVDSSMLSDATTISGIYGLVNSSARGEYSNILAEVLKGGNANVSNSLKAKYYAKQGATWAAAAGIVSAAFMLGKRLLNMITGKKAVKEKVNFEDPKAQEKEEDIFTPYDDVDEIPVNSNDLSENLGKVVNVDGKIADVKKKRSAKTTKVIKKLDKNQKQAKTKGNDTKKPSK